MDEERKILQARAAVVHGGGRDGTRGSPAQTCVVEGLKNLSVNDCGVGLWWRPAVSPPGARGQEEACVAPDGTFRR